MAPKIPLGAIPKGRPHRERGRGSSGKVDKVREVAWVYRINTFMIADKGGGRGSQNPKN